MAVFLTTMRDLEEVLAFEKITALGS